MKTLMILRHAKSSWKDASLADHDRPLNKRGKRDAPAMGRLIKKRDWVPDAVVTSTAKRARATARRVTTACDYRGEVLEDRRIYLGEPADLVETLRELPPHFHVVLVVGHNPGLEELLARLTGEPVTMPTAALARVELPIERWVDLDAATRGELLDVSRPKELSEEL